jgi:alkaline phosphatase
MRIKNAPELREMFEKSGKVKVVFSGHHHIGHLAEHNGIFYYTMRAMAQDAYPENNSFAEVSLYDSGRVAIKGFVKAASFDKRM